MKVKVAVSQKPSVLLDLKASFDVALKVVGEAANKGAQIIIFPEAFLPGYPTWIWRLKPGGDMELGNQIHAKLRENSIDLGRNGLEPLQKAAKENGVVIVVGFHEIDSQYSGTTLFNSLAIIGTNGEILNRHRKLVPTNPERMVWGQGDASGLRVVETPFGRIGALICWESYMPLARYALYAQNIEIYIAPTWDCGETWRASMSHIAREGGCWVLSSATALESGDVPPEFPGHNQLFPKEEWINSGDAVVVKPSGAILSGPLNKKKDILYADIDLLAAREARKSLDVAGHYGRPDIFHLEVDRQSKPPIVFS